MVIEPAVVSAGFQETQVFTCTAQGGPDNEYEWLFNGMAVQSSGVASTASMSTLTIDSVNISTGGNYTCRVSNVAGEDSERAVLYVTPYDVSVRASSVPNQLVSLLETMNGMEEILTCEAHSFPSPTYSWVRSSEVGSPQVVSNTATLSFLPINFGDEGVYTCIASNGLETNSAMVIIHGKIIALFILHGWNQGVCL